MNDKYHIYLFERKAICPICKGVMAVANENLKYKCIDCKSLFSVSGFGETEEYMQCEKVWRRNG